MHHFPLKMFCFVPAINHTPISRTICDLLPLNHLWVALSVCLMRLMVIDLMRRVN